MDTEGDFVVTWTSSGQDGSQRGIFARRFDAAAGGLGVEFQVNLQTANDQVRSAVGMDGDGDFVVTWASEDLDVPMRGVFARRFSALGVGLGSDFQINVFTPGSHSSPRRFAIDSDGNFVVAWQSFFQDGSDYGVFARRFNVSGAPQATPFLVNSHTVSGQAVAAVAIDGDGDFVVSWQSDSQDGSAAGVFARRFDVSGAPQATEFLVNTYTINSQYFPAIAMESDGDFVVAWTSDGKDGSSHGIFAQRFGVPKTFDFDANGATDPLTDGLLFLRYLFGFRGATLSTGAVAGNCTRCTPFLLETYLGGVVASTLTQSAGPELQINSYTGSDQSYPAAAASSAGNFVLVWDSAHAGSEAGIFARRFDGMGAPQAGEVQVNDYVTDVQRRASVGMDGDGDFVVVWESDTQDGSGYGVFARRFNATGVPQAAEFRVNSYTPGYQTRPVVAMRGAGDFVVAWESDGQDSSGYGVFARRFNATGAPQASEFQVNSYTADYQGDPAISIDGAGAFVVAWTSVLQDGSENGVFARPFNSGGTPQASEFRVNSHTLSSQSSPSLALMTGGDFVVAWQSWNQDGYFYGIFARRFDVAGTRLAAEFQVNSYTAGGQYRPVIASPGGDFVVGWQSYGQDGYGGGIFARRFDAAGVAQTAELQVNTYASTFQIRATLAMAGGGDFVVGWESGHQDGSGYGVFAQRFAASLAADLDGDGNIGALTDGLLLLRYLFGFRGATLVTGAVGADCTRCTAPAIESYIAAKV